LILFEYGKTFNFYFVGDDFSHIGFVMREKFRILWKSSNFFHYYPLGLFINSLPAWFNVLEPKWFVAVNFAFYLGCSILVMKIYRDIVGDLMGGFLAALIFATAVPNSQVIYWKTGTQSIAMPFFSLLSLIFFMRHLRKGSKAAFAGSFALYAASMLTIEQGIITLAILGLYDIVFYSAPKFLENKSDRKRVILGLVCRHSILALVPISLTSLKLALGLELSPFPLATRPWGMLPALSVNTIAQLLDLHRIVLSEGALTATVSIGVVITFLFFAGYVLVRADNKSLFFLVASVGSILTVCIAAGGPNARYFCLSAAFYACFLSLILKNVARAVIWIFRKALGHVSGVSSFLERKSGMIQHTFSIVLCLIIAFAGLRTNLIRREYWATASSIERNMVQTVEDLVLIGAIGKHPEQKLYLLNIPEHFISEKHSIFYVASNSIMPDLRHRLGDSADRVKLIATGRRFELPVENDRVIYRALGWKEQLSMKEVGELIEDGHVIMQFSPFSKTLVPLSREK
jgi:hypothetical protein